MKTKAGMAGIELNRIQDEVNTKKRPSENRKNKRMDKRMASLVRMKKFAIDTDEPLRSLILSQPDEIPLSEFQVKFIEWFKHTKLMEKEHQ